jgi:hypothetical protein
MKQALKNLASSPLPFHGRILRAVDGFLDNFFTVPP